MPFTVSFSVAAALPSCRHPVSCLSLFSRETVQTERFEGVLCLSTTLEGGHGMGLDEGNKEGGDLELFPVCRIRTGGSKYREVVAG